MDEQLKQDFFDSFSDIYDEVEHCLSEIKNNPDPELLNSLFRSIHNAKGNAGMMTMEKIVAFTHAIEEVAGAIRANRFPCSVAVGEIIQISMDRLKDLHLREVFGKPFDNLRETETIQQLISLARCDESEIEIACSKVLGFLGEGVSTPGIDPPKPKENVVTTLVDDDKLQTDLIFFQEMALQIDSLTQYWEGRSIQLFDWAMKINRIGGNVVPYEQFAAAVYMHDIGMSFIPLELLGKKGQYTDEEWRIMFNHPRWGYEWLRRVPGWEEAAKIVLDHHERVDGKGYPKGKLSNEIQVGAKIIAILDAFFSITSGRADRNHRKTVIRAISEINSGVDTQFDGAWVQCFNAMIRQELQSGWL